MGTSLATLRIEQRACKKSLVDVPISFDKPCWIWYRPVPLMRRFSTSEAAKMLGLHRPHLQRAIAQGRVPAPRLLRVGGVKVRLWTRKDVERARKALKKRKA